MTQVGVEEGTAALGELRSAIDKVRSTGVQRVADVSPALLASLKISAEVPPAEARERVRAGLFALAERLDPDLRRAFLESAGFRRDAAPAAGDRIKATATMLGTSERTAYRRVDEAVAEMALLLQSRDGRPALVDLDYVFLRSHFRVDLTGDAPLMVMERTISARSDGVSRIDERVNLPRTRHQQLHFRALEGCRVESNNFLTPGMWAITLSFPRPLNAGEEHTFAVSVRLPDHDSLEPVVGFFPHTASYDAAVDLQFGDRRPVALERFQEAPPVGHVSQIPGAEPVEPILARHHFSFTTMKPGFCYGVRWRWAETPDAAVPTF